MKPGSIKRPSMTSWLDVLRAVLPPSGVLLVGAGIGDGPWVQWLQSRGVASEGVPVHLVEGDEQQYQHLQHSLRAHTGWALRRGVVAASSGRVTFHRASNPAESGLLTPERLQQLWPHLDTEESIFEDAVTLDVLEQEAEGKINWLVLDCLPAASLLQGGAQLLAGLDVVLVRVAHDLPAELAADQQAVDELLRAVGLRCINVQAERHPAIAHALYTRDAARAQELGEQLKVAQEAWVKEKAELMQARAAASQKAQAAEQANVLAQEQAHRLQEQQLEAYQQGIKNLEKELRASFGKDLGNAVKQIEAFVSIQSYLNTGDSISGFHGWPISPDLGLFLIERIRERHYDLIIEFGSGISTILLAKVLQIQQRAAVSQPPSAGGELSRRICSFEHDPVYLRKTRDMLAARDLTSMVTLNHAPLLDWPDDTGRYLHYDCDATLAALAKQLADAPKRVLVLVDGPPGATCANARYPAVPKIFKHFARHEIDVVLDDASRPEEKAVIQLWRAFWKQRSMRVTDSTVPSEKGLFSAQTMTNQ